MQTIPFKDRHDAGRRLAKSLEDFAERDDVVVLALPRGGVPVAYEVAGALQAPLDVFLVRKLGLPGREEFAMGAIASGGVQVVNKGLVEQLGVSREGVEEVAAREHAELRRREEVYRGDRSMPDLNGKAVLVVDDGLATGSTMRAALTALRTMEPSRLVAAVPVGAPETCNALASEADEMICLVQPHNFSAVGQWYEDFSQTSDDEVLQLIRVARSEGRT